MLLGGANADVTNSVDEYGAKIGPIAAIVMTTRAIDRPMAPRRVFAAAFKTAQL
jgi:hypothetical protein